jgi:hypothetical protein
MLSALSWIVSARKWFKGPVPNISAEEIDKSASISAEGDDQSPVEKSSGTLRNGSLRRASEETEVS